MPNFVSVAASISELTHREKLHTQSINHSFTHSFTHLIWCIRNRSYNFATRSFHTKKLCSRLLWCSTTLRLLTQCFMFSDRTFSVIKYRTWQHQKTCSCYI